MVSPFPLQARSQSQFSAGLPQPTRTRTPQSGPDFRQSQALGQNPFLAEGFEPGPGGSPARQAPRVLCRYLALGLRGLFGSLWGFTRIVLSNLSGRPRYHVLGALNAISHEVVTRANTAYIHSQSVVDLLTKLYAPCSKLSTILVLDLAQPSCHHHLTRKV